MNLLELVLSGWVLAAITMSVLYYAQRRTENATPVDVGWAACIGLIAILGAILGRNGNARTYIISALGAIWAFRLAFHLYVDRVVGKSEDGRYETLRKNWDARAQVYFFWYYQAQAFFAALFAVPILIAAHAGGSAFRVWDLLGAIVWVIAILGEATADRQLKQFKKDGSNKGKTCRAGLWRYSRHPNYFFEWLHWWSYLLLAIGSPLFWINLAFPLVMLFFLLKVTGIPPAEEQALKTRGEDYRDYQRTTSVFIPWFPKVKQS